MRCTVKGIIAEGVKGAEKTGLRWNVHLYVTSSSYSWYMHALESMAFWYLIFYSISRARHILMMSSHRRLRAAEGVCLNLLLTSSHRLNACETPSALNFIASGKRDAVNGQSIVSHMDATDATAPPLLAERLLIKGTHRALQP